MRVLGIAGSLRADSHNRRLLRAAADELPPGAELVAFEGLKAVEPFDETDEQETGGGMPGADALITAIREADAILFVTPEYNGSIPGVLKNAVDWASRPTPATSPLANKPVAVIGASTSMFGAVWAQAELRKALGLAGARVVDQELAVPTAHEAFKDDGRLARGATRRRLREILAELVNEADPLRTSDRAPTAPSHS
ncbi:MAG: NAD(P)H-dependent oxidoreductase [Solirubrobacteraceae bacterium]